MACFTSGWPSTHSSRWDLAPDVEARVDSVQELAELGLAMPRTAVSDHSDGFHHRGRRAASSRVARSHACAARADQDRTNAMLTGRQPDCVLLSQSIHADAAVALTVEIVDEDSVRR
jgi:hypothetical protein